MSAEVVVCENCNVVLGRDGTRVVDRPATACSHLHSGAYVAAARVEELEARITRALAAASEPAGWSKARRILRGEDDTS